jgi:polar amino acid transport system substrate-binding protein
MHKVLPLAVVGLVFGLSSGCARRVDQIHQRGTLRWGGDQSGGGPYIFEQDGKLVGFEVDLAEYLARELGVRSEFVQGQWDKLPDRLNRGDIDIVLNGYEWTPEREREWASTVPYYIYKLQLLARSQDPTICNGASAKRST